MKEIPITVVELGTTNTVCLIGIADKNERIKIIGYGIAKTAGVRMGSVINPEYADIAVKSAISAAVANSGFDIDIRDVWVVFSGGTTDSKLSPGSVPISKVISQQDIDAAYSIAKNITLSNDRIMINEVINGYIVDGLPVNHTPVGLPAGMLVMNMQVIHTDNNSLERTLSSVENSGMNISGYLAAGLCAAEAVLSDEQKKSGVLLVNLGGGTISYSAYVNGTLSAVASFGVGGDHITRDICAAFHTISATDAEALKINSASAVVLNTDAYERAEIPVQPSAISPVKRSVSQHALNMVVNARIDETFRILRSAMDQMCMLNYLNSGIVLVGGGALLRNITTAVESVFNLPCQIGRIPESVFAVKPNNPYLETTLATAYGALIMASKEFREDTKPKHGVFSLFRRK